MNNPLAMMFQMMRGSRNPQQILNQMMGNSQFANNPMAKNAMSMLQNGDIKGVQNMAENLAKERGTTVDDVKNNIIQQFGMKQILISCKNYV